MSRKNVVITFDSARFCVVVNGQLIADEPSVIIRKKSESPVAIAVGKDAYEMKKSLSPNQMEVSPFRQGKILDDVSAKLFIKYLLKSKLKISTFSNLFILVPTGISEEDENNVERVFLSCGYSNVNLIKRADILTKIIALNNKNAMIYIDEDTTELIVSDSQSGFSSYAID
ncbi:MAG: rod shape-determining protein, partial [Clostridia bacterium]|nr:rod shape-determining protein [Clostridia bacterium]